MGSIRFDFENNMVCHYDYATKCIVMPKYVIKVLSRFDYYAYDVNAFLKVVDRLRNHVENTPYEELPEWIKIHVPKRYMNAFKNHLLFLYELR